MQPEEWSIVFYVEDSGRSTVEELVARLDNRTQLRIRAAIEQLRLRNVQAQEPLVRHLTGKLWELRVASQTNIFRLLYFFHTGRKIVFLHGFQKKTQRIPRVEMETAERRLDHFIEREGGATE